MDTANPRLSAETPLGAVQTVTHKLSSPQNFIIYAHSIVLICHLLTSNLFSIFK